MFSKVFRALYVLIMLVILMRVLLGLASADGGISTRYVCGDYYVTENTPRTNWFSVTNTNQEEVYLDWEVITGGSVVDRGAMILTNGQNGLVLGPGGFDVTLNVYLGGVRVNSVVSGQAQCAGGDAFLNSIDAGNPLPVNPVPVEEPTWFCGHTDINDYDCQFTVPSQNPIPDPVEFGCAVPLTITSETPLYWLPDNPTDAILQPGTTLGGGVLSNGWYDVLWVGQRLFLPAGVVQANGLVCVGD